MKGAKAEIDKVGGRWQPTMIIGTSCDKSGESGRNYADEQHKRIDWVEVNECSKLICDKVDESIEVVREIVWRGKRGG